MTFEELEAKAERGIRIARETFSYQTPMIGLRIPIKPRAATRCKAVKLFGGIGPKAHISLEHSDQAKGFLAVQVNAKSVVKWFQKARKHGWLTDGS
jgi:hypothetical protein